MIIRFTSGLLKCCLWFVVIALATVALYLSVGRMLAHSATTYHKEIENFIQTRIADFVQLGEIEGAWQGFDPTIEIRGLALVPNGEVALEIDRLKLKIDSYRSFFKASPIITEVEISGVRFSVRRESGRLVIVGLEPGGRSFNVQSLLDSLPYLQVLRLNGIAVEILHEDRVLWVKSEPGSPWIISAEGEMRHISLPLILERQTEDGLLALSRLSLIGEYIGDLRSSDYGADLYLEVPHLELENFVPPVNFGQGTLSSAILEARLWFSIETGQVDVTGEFDIKNVDVHVDGSDIELLESVAGMFRYRGADINNGSLSVPHIEFKGKSRHFELNDFRLAISSDEIGGRLVGQIESLDLRELVSLVELGGDTKLLSERFSGAFTAVNPRGALADIHFFSNFDGSGIRVVSLIEGVALDAYLGVPAINRIDGLLSLSPRRGYLDINNEAFEMDFRSMFSQSWPFSSGRGRVGYELVDGQFSVHSGLIELKNGELKGLGKISLNLPSDRSKQTWGLSLGVVHAQLLDARRYIPTTISQDLVGWLDQAIQAGRVSESGLLFHGALFRGAPSIRKAHDLYFEVEEAILRYEPEWPPLTELGSQVHINNYFVNASSDDGRVLSSDLVRVTALAPIRTDGSVDTIRVDAEATGPFGDAIRVLNETPLKDSTNHVAQHWHAQGQMTAMLKLDVPIGSRVDDEVHSEVRLTYSDASLAMPEFDLKIDDLYGTATYNNESGLNSSGFTGITFQRPVDGTIRSSVSGATGEIVVELTGAIDAKELYEWSDQILLSRGDGELAYRAVVHAPYGVNSDEGYVEASSDLVGFTLALPHPLGKADANSSRRFEYRQVFLEPGYRVEMSLDETVRAALKISEGIVQGGRVHFGADAFGAVAFDGIRMTGELGNVDFAQWEKLTEDLAAISDVSFEEEIAAHVISVKLKLKQLMIFGLPLNDPEIVVTRDSDAWLVEIENKMLGGLVTIPDADDEPFNIDLNHLTLEANEDGIDPLADVWPMMIDRFNFSTEKLVIDSEDYGSWAFEYRTNGDVARFEKLKAIAPGLNILPSSTIQWQRQSSGHSSHFQGLVTVEDLGLALRSFGYASSIEGTDMGLNIEVSWPGSPAMVDVNTVVGDVGILRGKGSIVQADTGGALKLLGIFDFAQLGRRFRLDFSDVVEQGYEFKNIKGVATFNNGVIDVKEPIVIEGSSGIFTAGGQINLITRALDNDMIVTLPVSRTLPWYAAYSAIATGPLTGAGVLLAQRVFQNQINQMSSAKYKISGTMEEPVIQFVTIFDDKVREPPTEPSQEPSQEPSKTLIEPETKVETSE